MSTFNFGILSIFAADANAFTLVKFWMQDFYL